LSADRAAGPVLGCIDIGTNTTRLLVAQPDDGGLRELATQRAFTRVGRSLLRGGAIPREKIEETAAVVAGQARAARQVGAAELVAVATAVIRDAPNREELAEAVRHSGGTDLCMLSGEEEARLSFVGAARTLAEPVAGALAVADVGGPHE
jgi:exopolyphosphatase/guanosine-5'-triphosphate,3'-diphosphate pyrophosphatase